MKTASLTRERAIQIILKRFHEIETVWDKSSQRSHQLSELSSFLSNLETNKEIDIHHLTRLHRHITPYISLEQLWTLMVPVEREFSKTNIVDEDFLITTDDSPKQEESIMPASVAADNIRSSFNIGGIFRTADCAGMDNVYLCGYSATPENPKVQKSSMGAHSSVPWSHEHDIKDLAARLHDENVQLIALETMPTASPPAAADIRFPCTVLLGNERFGLGKDMLAQADTVINIPVYGSKNSLNVVSAFSICAYEIRRRWEQAKGK
ncbi:hypothetical protein BVX97_03440 [bacterium E08(2017)]|nr:hypothetical protein BVX97_03440 [bacterium E08(2017)]